MIYTHLLSRTLHDGRSRMVSSPSFARYLRKFCKFFELIWCEWFYIYILDNPSIYFSYPIPITPQSYVGMTSFHISSFYASVVWHKHTLPLLGFSNYTASALFWRYYHTIMHVYNFCGLSKYLCTSFLLWCRKGVHLLAGGGAIFIYSRPRVP